MSISSGCYETIEKAISCLRNGHVGILAVSDNYVSPALGLGTQPDFLNCVVSLTTSLPPAGLLKTLKAIEGDAGRCLGARWGSRPLDIDILDYRGQVLNWHDNGRTSRGNGLILPHPEMHKRAFVLKPLRDIAPAWRHPVFDATAQQLLMRLAAQRRQTAMRV